MSRKQIESSACKHLLTYSALAVNYIEVVDLTNQLFLQMLQKAFRDHMTALCYKKAVHRFRKGQNNRIMNSPLTDTCYYSSS